MTTKAWQVRQGDALEVLRTLPSESVHCCVTSPPYWGLRDYGTVPVIFGGISTCSHKWQNTRYYTEQTAAKCSADAFSEAGKANAARLKDGRWRDNCWCVFCDAWRGQLGLEPTPELFVEHMVAIFREVRRVLRSDGTLWLNIGDSYSSGGHGGGGSFMEMRGGNGSLDEGAWSHRKDAKGWRNPPPGLKPKDLCGIPWMLAFALRADGWYLRQDIIWSKPNPMPESVTDRCTKAHEYLFLLSKSARYYYDQEAVLEECSPNTNARLSQDVEAQIGSERANGGQKTNGNMKAVGRTPASWRGSSFTDPRDMEIRPNTGTNRKLAESGSGIKSNESFSNAVCCLVEKRNKRSVWEVTTQGYSEAHFATFPPKLIEPCILAGCPEGGTVLDPFSGAGTTGLVATRFARNYIGIELNPAYVEMSEERIGQDAPLFNLAVDVGSPSPH